MTLDDIIKKASETLNISIVSNELEGVYDEIKAHLIRIHPDNFSEDDIKEDSLIMSQNATELLSELKKEIERKRLTETALVPYDQNKINIDNFEYRLIMKESEIFKLKQELQEKHQEIKELKEKIKEMNDISKQVRTSDIVEKKEKLISSNKPKGSAYFTAGGAGLLLIIFNVFNSIESLSIRLTSYLPFSSKVTNIGIFSVLLITIIAIIYKQIKTSMIRSYLNRIITQNNLSAIGCLVNKGQISRQAIHDYFIQDFKKRSWISKFMNKLFGINNPVIIEEALDMVVDYMISNSYIEKLNVKNMVQNYKVLELTLWEIYRQSET